MLDTSSRPAIGGLMVVLNGGAGSAGQKERRALLTEIWTAAGRPFEFVAPESGTGIDAAARSAARAARRRGMGLVAVGGDGTVNAVAQAAWTEQVPFGVVPGGTFNYFARDHGIPLDPEAAARALLEAELTLIHPGQVNGRLFLVNASLGLYRRLLEDREAFKRRFGRSRVIAMISGIASLLRRRGQLRLLIENEGCTRGLRTPSLFVGGNRLQLEQLGIPVADELERGRLGAIVVRPVDSLHLVALALRGALGVLGDAEHLDAFPITSLSVAVAGRRTIKVARDGEVVRMRLPLRFERTNRPLQLMLPPQAMRVKRE